MSVKATIALPDALKEAVDARAAELGESRSAFFVRAALARLAEESPSNGKNGGGPLVPELHSYAESLVDEGLVDPRVVYPTVTGKTALRSQILAEGRFSPAQVAEAVLEILERNDNGAATKTQGVSVVVGGDADGPDSGERGSA